MVENKEVLEDIPLEIGRVMSFLDIKGVSNRFGGIKALDAAQCGYVLDNGRIVFSGNSRDLAENEDVKEFYLGMKVKASVKGYRRYKKKKKWR